MPRYAPQPLRLSVPPQILYSAQIPQPCASYKEEEVPNCGCAYVCWFNNQTPKDIIVLASQCLAAADNMLYCFDPLPAESTGTIPFKQTHST
jgi:hypothetical protein